MSGTAVIGNFSRYLFRNVSMAIAALSIPGPDGLIEVNCAPQPCHEDFRSVAYPRFQEAKVPIAVVFGCRRGSSPMSAIYVFHASKWQLVHAGNFVRGSLLSGRGGKGNRYLMINSCEFSATLQVKERILVLNYGKEYLSLFKDYE